MIDVWPAQERLHKICLVRAVVLPIQSTPAFDELS